MTSQTYTLTETINLYPEGAKGIVVKNTSIHEFAIGEAVTIIGNYAREISPCTPNGFILQCDNEKHSWYLFESDILITQLP